MDELERLINSCMLAGVSGPALPEWLAEGLRAGLAGITIFPGPHLADRGAVAAIAAEARAVDPQRIGCPVLLVSGEEDGVATPSAVQMMRERLPRASATVLPKCGHWATIERPEDCNANLREFLSRNRP